MLIHSERVHRSTVVGVAAFVRSTLCRNRVSTSTTGQRLTRHRQPVVSNRARSDQCSCGTSLSGFSCLCKPWFPTVAHVLYVLASVKSYVSTQYEQTVGSCATATDPDGRARTGSRTHHCRARVVLSAPVAAPELSAAPAAEAAAPMQRKVLVLRLHRINDPQPPPRVRRRVGKCTFKEIWEASDLKQAGADGRHPHVAVKVSRDGRSPGCYCTRRRCCAACSRPPRSPG